MNWDKEASKHADATKPATEWELELIGDQTWEVAVLDGAKWMRKQLRTPEAIERAARAIHDDECACGDLNNDRYGDDGTLYYLDKARIAITALLGEG